VSDGLLGQANVGCLAVAKAKRAPDAWRTSNGKVSRPLKLSLNFHLSGMVATTTASTALPAAWKVRLIGTPVRPRTEAVPLVMVKEPCGDAGISLVSTPSIFRFVPLFRAKAVLILPSASAANIFWSRTTLPAGFACAFRFAATALRSGTLHLTAGPAAV
jgi:hypothetical protein